MRHDGEAQIERQGILVLDNANELSLFGVDTATRNRTGTLLDYALQGPVGTPLWTSRDQAIAGSVVGLRRSIHVPSMTLEESRTLLESTIPQIEGEQEVKNMDSLIEEVQNLPLAIHHAVTYMRRTETTISQYLELSKEEQTRWRTWKEPEFDGHRARGSSNSILQTWSTSISRIRQENEMTYMILLILAFCDSEDISQQLVDDAAAHGQDGQAQDALERNKWNAVRRLKDFSFLNEQRGDYNIRVFEMNKLVRDAVRCGLCTASVEREIDVRLKRLRRKRTSRQGILKSK